MKNSCEQVCIEDSGGGVPGELIVTGSQGLCIYPGQKAKTPDTK